MNGFMKLAVVAALCLLLLSCAPQQGSTEVEQPPLVTRVKLVETDIIKDHFNAGLIAHERGDHEGAITQFLLVDRRVSGKQMRFSALVNSGVIAFGLGDVKRASFMKSDAEMYLSSVESLSDIAKLYLLESALLYSRQKYEDSIERATKAIQLDGRLGKAYFNRALSSYKLTDAVTSEVFYDLKSACINGVKHEICAKL